MESIEESKDLSQSWSSSSSSDDEEPETLETLEKLESYYHDIDSKLSQIPDDGSEDNTYEIGYLNMAKSILDYKIDMLRTKVRDSLEVSKDLSRSSSSDSKPEPLEVSKDLSRSSSSSSLSSSSDSSDDNEPETLEVLENYLKLVDGLSQIPDDGSEINTYDVEYINMVKSIIIARMNKLKDPSIKFSINDLVDLKTATAIIPNLSKL